MTRADNAKNKFRMCATSMQLKTCINCCEIIMISEGELSYKKFLKIESNKAAEFSSVLVKTKQLTQSSFLKPVVTFCNHQHKHRLQGLLSLERFLLVLFLYLRIIID